MKIFSTKHSFSLSRRFGGYALTHNHWEQEMKALEEEWDHKKEKQMDQISEKQKKWQQSPDIDIFDEEDFFEHDEL